ncbi:hypothetical protein HII31_02613 [Pseudocercospora fuligena]|uniref:Uncharacterized protein n=1 Tax=Pseudocercospora fuligena TaxID=685502 RepID=A0A8H6VMR1_9PEZI|nr:hypothetical protein HII31_02613 [Pseudocercospora fuligena]
MARLVKVSDMASELESDYGEIYDLCFEGGTTIINLVVDQESDDDFKYHLALPTAILQEASGFFKHGGNDAWTTKARTVTNPITDKEVKLLDYHLKLDKKNRAVVLDTETYDWPNETDHPQFRPFYQSELASGTYDRADDKLLGGKGLAREAQVAHRALFALLLNVEDDLTDLDFRNIADIVAYAEMYDLLPYIASALRKHILSRPDLYDDVRKHYFFHMGLARKVRCVEVWFDACRHYIGSGQSLSRLDKLDLTGEEKFKIAEKRERLEENLDDLQAELEQLTLSTYIPHAKHTAAEPVKTTYLSLTNPRYGGHSEIARGQEIARRIVMEWLNHQRSGKAHWSYVRSFNYDEGGVFSGSSLRNLCNLATEAVQTRTELDLFDMDAAALSVKNSNIGRDGDQTEIAYTTEFVKEELKKLVFQIASLALPYIAPPDFKPTKRCTTDDANMNVRGRHAPRDGTRGPDGPGFGGASGFTHRPRARCHEHKEIRYQDRNFYSVGMTAQNDEDCHYFTCIDLGEEDCPWDEEFDEYVIEGLELASEKWLKAVGVVESEEGEDET